MVHARPVGLDRNVRFGSKADVTPLSSGALFGDAPLQNCKVLLQAKQLCRGRQAVVFEEAETHAQVIPFVSQVDQ